MKNITIKQSTNIRVLFPVGRYLIAFLILIIVLFPLYWVLNVVFAPPGSTIVVTQKFYPTSLSAGIEKIIDVIKLGPFSRAYFVTLLYASLQISGMLIITSMASFEFALFNFPGKNALFILALSAMMVPQAVTILPLFKFISALGWVNTLQGLAVPSMATSLYLFILKQYMEEIPLELIEAATIDGVSHFGIYRHIVLPLSKNALFTVSILSFVFAWGNFLWPIIVSNSPKWYTISVLVAGLSAKTSYTTTDQVVTAYLLASIPPIIIYIFLQRFIIDSVAMSGIKG